MALITDRALATKPKKNDIWLSDPAPRGHGRFYARITPDGRRLFYFKYTSQAGKREYIPLGAYDQDGVTGLTLKDARAKAGELSMLYKAGAADVKGFLEEERRLAEAKRAEEHARLEASRIAAEVEAARMSVRGLFEKWEALHLSQRKDAKEICRIFAKDVFPVIGDLPAHLVRKGHIMQVVDCVTARGANRLAKIVFTSLRTMFKFALERDFVEVDPTATISKKAIGGKDVERERTLSDEEVALLATKMPSAGLLPTTAAAVWITLSTGCRIGELLKARWEHVDLDARRWAIPAENSKNGLPHEVFLSDFALVQFRVLEQFRSSDWLYPARNKKKGDTHVCDKTITKQTGDRQRVKVKSKGTQNKGTLALPGGHWTMHDLRRTCSTIMADIGIKPEVIDRCQNHVEPNKVRRIYQRYSYQPEMKTAWELLGSRLEALTSVQSVAKVIPLWRDKTAS